MLLRAWQRNAPSLENWRSLVKLNLIWLRGQPKEALSRSFHSLMNAGLHTYLLEDLRLSSVALLSSRDGCLSTSIQKMQVIVWADPRQLFSFLQPNLMKQGSKWLTCLPLQHAFQVSSKGGWSISLLWGIKLVLSSVKSYLELRYPVLCQGSDAYFLLFSTGRMVYSKHIQQSNSSTSAANFGYSLA